MIKAYVFYATVISCLLAYANMVGWTVTDSVGSGSGTGTGVRGPRGYGGIYHK